MPRLCRRFAVPCLRRNAPGPRAGPAVSWAWPASLPPFPRIVAAGRRAAAVPPPVRRLVAWEPSNPAGQQLTFAVLRDDGTEARLYESQLDALLASSPA